jgi:hypothetical protein
MAKRSLLWQISVCKMTTISLLSMTSRPNGDWDSDSKRIFTYLMENGLFGIGTSLGRLIMELQE